MARDRTQEGVHPFQRRLLASRLRDPGLVTDTLCVSVSSSVIQLLQRPEQGLGSVLAQRRGDRSSCRSEATGPAQP